MSKIVNNAAGDCFIRDYQHIRYLIKPGDHIEHHCFARLVPSMVRLKLDGFRDQWCAEVVEASSGTYIFHVPIRGSVLERFFGVWPTLAVDIRCLFPQDPRVGLAEVVIVIRPKDCSQRKGAELLERVGPTMLESIRTFLQANPDRRGDERVPFEQPVTVIPLFEDGRMGDPIPADSRDISLHGMGLMLPYLPPTPKVCLQFAWSNSAAPMSLLAKVMSIQDCPDGTQAVGVFFLQNLGD